MFVLCATKEKIYPAYLSKYNSNCKKQVFVLIIPNEKKWHYLAVKKLSASLGVITSKHHDDFYCLNCFHSFATKRKRHSDKRACENKDFCNIIMPFQNIKILEFNQY